VYQDALDDKDVPAPVKQELRAFLAKQRQHVAVLDRAHRRQLIRRGAIAASWRPAPRVRIRGVNRPGPGSTIAAAVLLGALLGPLCGAAVAVEHPADAVDPWIGTAGGGNTFPGAVVPFGMVQWSPETTRGDATRVAAPGGYAWDARRVRGFSLTHLSGTGCRGASGDVPFMPHGGPIAASPSADSKDEMYAERFSHANETARAGRYRVVLASGVAVELTATARTGAARFAFPAGQEAALLLRVSDSEVGSSDARVEIDPAARTVRGEVTSGNFCGYLDAAGRRSYYTLYFVAVFDRELAAYGTWEDGALHPGATAARGGTGYGADGYPVAGHGSGAWVSFAGGGAAGAAAKAGTAGGADAGSAGSAAGVTVGVRVGISYVSAAGAAANLLAENPPATGFDDIARRARAAWDGALGRIEIGGATPRQRTIFYTALYHALLHPNLWSDADGRYAGFDGQVHAVAGGAGGGSGGGGSGGAGGGWRQRAQYANFSGWDVYRSQLALVALLVPDVAADMAQSLLNQAAQNGGEWDRWTHNSGATHVMEGDPSPAAVAGIAAFGATGFDLAAAYASLARAATVPTAHDRSGEGCPVECPGQRPALDRWLELHYIPAGANAWGGAGETLEDAAADFSLAQLARRAGDAAGERAFLERSGYWRNVWNPHAAADGGYVEDRNADGSWPAAFDPAAEDGFAEGSSAQYSWMVPFDGRGLVDAMGGNAAAGRRLDAFFHLAGGAWALTGLGGTHAELDNEPSLGAPWMYLFAGRPDRTQETVRAALERLWSERPRRHPRQRRPRRDVLLVRVGRHRPLPRHPRPRRAADREPARAARGRAPRQRADGDDRGARRRAAIPYVQGLRLDGKPWPRPWLPESFVARGGRLDFDLAPTPAPGWGSAAAAAPPSFPPPLPPPG
jgi:predicted alpha-1,2-mannosidase